MIAVLEKVQMLDQKIRPPGPVAKKFPDLGQCRQVYLPPLRLPTGLAASRTWMRMPVLGFVGNGRVHGFLPLSSLFFYLAVSGP